MKTMVSLFLAAFITAFAGPVSTVLADGEIVKLITPADSERLAKFESLRKEAIAEAEAGGSAQDVKTLHVILAGDAMRFDEAFNPTGNWKCRTIKLGGNLPLVIYDWFSCRINDDGSGWKLEKLTGSQRTSGRLFTESDTRLTYLGAGHYSDERPKAYGAETDRDEVAYLVRPGKKRLRLEFPLPKLESKFNIIEMTR